MSETLDTRQLLAFVTLARCGSFTQAAKELFLTQSAVSHAMKALEGEVGSRLFDRVGKRVLLTQSGEQLLRHAERILREMRDARAGLQELVNTRHVIEAARQAGVRKVVLISFLRARPNCGSGYHESKWQAEEIVRRSGLDYTVFKCGVIYGKGDHMLDHLSHAFHTFPVFAFVGFNDRPIRPNAVEDVRQIVKAALTEGALSGQTVAVLGLEELTLRQAVRRVACVVGRKPLMFPLPLWFHYALGWCVEKIMAVPLVSVAQVQMLAEGLAEASQPCDPLPAELSPRISFSEEQIRKGLPPAGPFGMRDLRCCYRKPRGRCPRAARVFFEMP
jgi:NADH dehydrogenase